MADTPDTLMLEFTHQHIWLHEPALWRCRCGGLRIDIIDAARCRLRRMTSDD